MFYLFQRSTYGNGYYLTLVLNNGSDTSTSGTEEGQGKMSFTDSLKKNPFNDLDDIQDGRESTQQILNVAPSPGFLTNSFFTPFQPWDQIFAENVAGDWKGGLHHETILKPVW